MKIGSKAKIIKKTFLNKGIFIFTNSVVQIESIQNNKIMATYMDKEGYPHSIEFEKEDLELIK